MSEIVHLPFTCNACEREFKTAHALKIHIVRNPECKARHRQNGGLPKDQHPPGNPSPPVTLGGISDAAIEELAELHKPRITFNQEAFDALTPDRRAEYVRQFAIKVVPN